MACCKVLVTVLVFFLQSFPVLVPTEATNTATLPLTNTTKVKVRCVKSERNALLRFKQSLMDPSDRLASWVGQECCMWKGVSCDIQTDLGENDFQGFGTPNFLGSLEKLQYLNLSLSSLVGIPPSLGNLSNLRYLDIYAYSYPYHTAESSSVKDLNWVSGLSSLKYLDLSFVDLSLATNCQLDHNDWVPPFSLIEVELRSCSLGPNFPTWLETQKQLEVVILSSDSISDPIPPWLWNLCSQLQYLDLSDNQIGGNLPRLVSFKSYYSSWTVDFYSSYKYGVVVDLSSNCFNGLLPLWPDVTHMNLANNLFSGSIPITIGHVMTKLQVLDLSGNAFTGSIPYSITKVKKLLRLDISDNHLSGKLPDWWYELQQLHVIDLLGNNLSGGIPPSVCSPPSVFWLRLSRNNLSGELPKSLRNCNSLVTLDIGENKINGSIPQWFGERLLSLQKLRMTGI
ncbi:hypothetical protein K7X08_009403 [Anisodus acutangulus]|uniref:Leucine-rich repeat-containing N-terminal plant-type domain-containing protein n=1 Tax=Anisodus acutangulus TaxID=402998 RepID=A0A9Q1MZ94_9SOLA|nr:hypothetical protein K7X08_009403 [Anisodus acutangulus]